MLNRLRRGSKAKPNDTHRQITTDNPGHTTGPHELTFLDLPAELRNTIYEHVAATTTLVLRPRGGVFTRHLATPSPSPPSLSLVSRQVRRESHPVLLATARVVADVRDYDFRGVGRMAASLYGSELKLLRANARLAVRLHVSRAGGPGRRGRRRGDGGDDLAPLRRWLVKRADSLDRLPWGYEVGWAPAPGLTPVTKREILQAHLVALARYGEGLHEALRWEMAPLVEALERESFACEMEIFAASTTRICD